MAAEESTENADGMEEKSSEEVKKWRIRAFVLGAFLVVGILALVYSLNSQTKLDDQIKAQQEQIQKQDSLLEQANQELKMQTERAEQLQKKSAEQVKKTVKSAKSKLKKSKTKKN